MKWTIDARLTWQHLKFEMNIESAVSDDIKSVWGLEHARNLHIVKFMSAALQRKEIF